MPEIVLLDTGVVSAFLKTRQVDEETRDKVEREMKGGIGLISFITVAELFYWAECKSWGEKKRANLDERLRAYGVVDPTRATAEIWAKTMRACDKMGKTKQKADLWIAASAIEHDIRLLTLDGGFEGIPDLKVTRL